MIWKFSDGTTVELGGNVEGATVFAQQLRRSLERGASIQLKLPPARPDPLDLENAAQLDLWLAAEIEWRNRIRKLGLRFTERPKDLPPLPAQPVDENVYPDGAIF